jgi:hypothetical protein
MTGFTLYQVTEVIRPLQITTVQVPKVKVPETPPPQQIALAPFDIRTWPAVPQELAQSMMPAPGLIAFVLLPVSQLLPPGYPTAN